MFETFVKSMFTPNEKYTVVFTALTKESLIQQLKAKLKELEAEEEKEETTIDDLKQEIKDLKNLVKELKEKNKGK